MNPALSIALFSSVVRCVFVCVHAFCYMFSYTLALTEDGSSPDLVALAELASCRPLGPKDDRVVAVRFWVIGCVCSRRGEGP